MPLQAIALTPKTCEFSASYTQGRKEQARARKAKPNSNNISVLLDQTINFFTA